jgi:hypothetical protein
MWFSFDSFSSLPTSSLVWDPSPNEFNNDNLFIGQYLVFLSKKTKRHFGILNEGFNKGLDFYRLFAQGSIYGLDSFACFLTLGYLGPLMSFNPLNQQLLNY